MARRSQNENALWFFAGAALGATIALLYAPHSGEETRKKLKGAARKGVDSVADSGRQIAELGREMYEKGRKIADDAASMLDRGRKLIDDPTPNEEA